MNWQGQLNSSLVCWAKLHLLLIQAAFFYDIPVQVKQDIRLYGIAKKQFDMVSLAPTEGAIDLPGRYSHCILSLSQVPCRFLAAVIHIKAHELAALISREYSDSIFMLQMVPKYIIA